MSSVDVLVARIRIVQAQLDEAEGYARSCRAAVTRLDGPINALSGMSIDVGGMRSRSAKVDRARARARSAEATVGSVRSTLAGAVGDLSRIAAKYEHRAEVARTELKTATAALAGQLW